LETLLFRSLNACDFGQCRSAFKDLSLKPPANLDECEIPSNQPPGARGHIITVQPATLNLRGGGEGASGCREMGENDLQPSQCPYSVIANRGKSNLIKPFSRN
jgi:hypothetical protein